MPTSITRAALPAQTRIRRWEPLTVFALTFAILALFTPRITTYLDPVTGDEPYYLMTAISIWQDRDLNECNNYRQLDENQFYPYFYVNMKQALLVPPGWLGWSSVPYPLPPHPANLVPASRECLSTNPAIAISPTSTSTELYSKHGLGLSLLVLLPFVAGGRLLVVFFLNFLAALLAANVYLFAREGVGKVLPALLTLAAFAFTVPQMPYSYLIFPELPAALLTLYAFRRIRVLGNNGLQVAAIGLCMAFLPWLHYRFAPVSVALFIYFVYQQVRQPSRMRLLNLALVFGQLAVSAVLLMIFFYSRYRQIFPDPADHAGSSDAAGTMRGAVGLFLDQQWGLLVAAPIYILAIVGVLLMLEERRWRKDLFWIGLVFVPYFGVVANYAQWWGEWCPPARYLASVLPLLALPFAVSLDVIKNVAYKAIYGALMLLSLLTTWGFLFQPQWMYNQPTGQSQLLIYGLPGFLSAIGLHLPAELLPSSWLPSFVVPYFVYGYYGDAAGDASAAQAWSNSLGPGLFIVAVVVVSLCLAWWPFGRPGRTQGADAMAPAALPETGSRH